MKLSDPLSTVSPGPNGRVLTVLARTDKPLTGRTVASLVRPHTSLRAVQMALEDLVTSGVVSREAAGGSHLHVLNHDHLAAAPIVALANLRTELLDRIRVDVHSWEPAPTAVWLFGSVARGDSGTDSDVDLFVVRPDDVDPDSGSWLAQVDALSNDVTKWTGNGCEVLELSHRELRAALDRDDRLVSDLRADAVHLAGAEPRILLRKRVTR